MISWRPTFIAPRNTLSHELGNENTWYHVHASSKKQNMVCLSSGKSFQSELMALIGGACECIATRDQWSKLCKCSVHGQLSSSWICEMQGMRVGALVTWTQRSILCMPGRWNAGQRILKRHGDSQQVADCTTKITTLPTSSSQSPWTNAAICRTSMRGCRKSLPTKSLHLTRTRSRTRFSSTCE